MNFIICWFSKYSISELKNKLYNDFKILYPDYEQLKTWITWSVN